MGISEDRITAIGYGQTKPLVANDSSENMKLNRRVTARITK
jgi:outer membrane protein OmpA-like peptidoglycan-associated protein